jgi:Xaa-Pro aminopeptidase
MSGVPRLCAERLLRKAGLDALVLAKPESFAWATGAPPGVASFFRRAGSALALLPAAAGEPIAAVATELFAPHTSKALGDAHVLTHSDWVETADIRPWLNSADNAAELMQRARRADGRPAGFTRPAAFDARRSFEQLGALLHQRGLAGARIGLDLDFWPVSDFALLQEVLPGLHWVDASAVIGRIKAVKSGREIALLQQAAALAEAGMRRAVASVHMGQHRDAIAQARKGGVAAEVQRRGLRLSGQWEYTTVGPLPWQGSGQIGAGDVLKFDVGQSRTAHRRGGLYPSRQSRIRTINPSNSWVCANTIKTFSLFVLSSHQLFTEASCGAASLAMHISL